MFVLWSVSLTKLLILGILVSTALRAVAVAKLLIPGISILTSFILPLKVVLVTKLAISGILSLIFLILALCTSFLATWFSLNHLVYLNQQKGVLIYQDLVYLRYF